MQQIYLLFMFKGNSNDIILKCSTVAYQHGHTQVLN